MYCNCCNQRLTTTDFNSLNYYRCNYQTVPYYTFSEDVIQEFHNEEIGDFENENIEFKPYVKNEKPYNWNPFTANLDKTDSYMISELHSYTTIKESEKEPVVRKLTFTEILIKLLLKLWRF